MTIYPKIVKAAEVAGEGTFGPMLFRIKGGRALYDEVWLNDGGRAFYLARVLPDLTVTLRWIPWETEVEMLYDPKGEVPEVVKCALCGRTEYEEVKSDYLRVVSKYDGVLSRHYFKPRLSVEEIFRLPSRESQVCTNRRACGERQAAKRRSQNGGQP